MTDTAHPQHASHAATDMAGLVRLLHERGQRATPQRLVILRELQRRGHHATADEIRRRTRNELPGTSTPTVYATLELLVELGLARRVDAGSGATLYDPRIEPHQHAVCRRCGRIDDVDGEVDVEQLRRRAAETGFTPDAVEVVISGLCASCAAS
jgi:Fur family transcriptional regulator, stress-responsive regulator